MTAFVGESGVHSRARFGMDARLRGYALENRPKEAFTLRVSDCTGYLTLLTANTALRVDKDSLHNNLAPFRRDAKRFMSEEQAALEDNSEVNQQQVATPFRQYRHVTIIGWNEASRGHIPFCGRGTVYGVRGVISPCCQYTLLQGTPAESTVRQACTRHRNTSD